MSLHGNEKSSSFDFDRWAEEETTAYISLRLGEIVVAFDLL